MMDSIRKWLYKPKKDDTSLLAQVLTITNAIMDVLIGDERANRDFRVKFPEDVLQDNLAGQLWFGAELPVLR
nr:unnamed protein product [Callosobruchus chinensis]